MRKIIIVFLKWHQVWQQGFQRYRNEIAQGTIHKLHKDYLGGGGGLKFEKLSSRNNLCMVPKEGLKLFQKGHPREHSAPQFIILSWCVSMRVSMSSHVEGSIISSFCEYIEDRFPDVSCTRQGENKLTKKKLERIHFFFSFFLHRFSCETKFLLFKIDFTTSFIANEHE